MRRAATLLCLWYDVPIEATYSHKKSLCFCIASLILSSKLRSSLNGERSFLPLLYNVSDTDKPNLLISRLNNAHATTMKIFYIGVCLPALEEGNVY